MGKDRLGADLCVRVPLCGETTGLMAFYLTRFVRV